MMSADRADLAAFRRSNGGLQQIASARGTEAVLLATARAAHELAHAAGLCAIPSDDSNAMIAMVEDSTVMLLDAHSSLGELVASVAQGNGTTVQSWPPIDLPLTAGPQLNAETLLTVPLGMNCGYVGFAFFWSQGRLPNAEQLALLPGLAWASCLALRSQRDAAELQQVRAEQRAQINEIQHRARNVLAVVRSVIRRSGHAAESPEEFAAHIEGRIGALARTQGALIVDAQHGPELEDLIRTELTANAVADVQLSITGPSLRLVPRAAETIALTLHELTTNALKFGALTVPEGRIGVNWRIASAPSPMLHWSWIESNVRVAQTRPQRRGFGRELIENVLPYELGAATRFSLEASGLRCEIDLPINERTTGIAASAAGGGRQP
jgi:two-component sensor histidine kinase